MNSCVNITNKDKEKSFRNEPEETKIVTYCLKKHCFDHTKNDTSNRFMKKLLKRMTTLTS
jgi:hypothetical protein